MIRTIKNKGLKRLYEKDDRSKLPAADVEKIRRILARLDTAKSAEYMQAPTFHLHQLKGRLKGHWAVTVRGNWRVTFRLEQGDAFDVDYLDYH